MIRNTVHRAHICFILFGVFMAVGCTPQPRTLADANQLMIKNALSQVDYPEESVIQYFNKEIPKEATILLTMNKIKIVINESGYLVEIDEKPDYDFEHPIKFVFVPVSHPENPQVLFEGSAFPSVSIIVDGQDINDGNWSTI